MKTSEVTKVKRKIMLLSVGGFVLLVVGTMLALTTVDETEDMFTPIVGCFLLAVSGRASLLSSIIKRAYCRGLDWRKMLTDGWGDKDVWL